MQKKIWRIFFLTVVIAAIVFFGFVPGYVDKSRNTVSQKITNPQKVSWYDSIPFIADLHCDELLWNRNLLKEHDYGHVDVPRMLKANMALQVFTIVSKTPRNMNIEHNDGNSDNITLLSFAQLRPFNSWFNITNRVLAQCNDLRQAAADSKGQLRLVTSKETLRQFIEERKNNQHIMAALLGIEGAHCLGNDIGNTDKVFNAGVRYIGLAHFFDNEWAGSAHGMQKGGLTGKGKELVKKMDSMHIIIDLAHASPKTIDDVLAFTSSPVIVSHTGVQGVCNNTRNLSDKHLLEIGKHNGLVGIGLWETAVCGTDAAATAKSIRYVANKIGVDKVALGSDFDGAIKTHFDVTGLPLIVNALLKEGFNRSEIEMIMGGNIRDFFLRNLPER